LEKIESHAKRPPPAVSDVRDDVPAETIAGARPDVGEVARDRYQTPAEVAVALAPWAGVDGAMRQSRRGRRRRWIATAAGILLCGLLLAGWSAGWNPFGGHALDVEERSDEAQGLYREGVHMLDNAGSRR